MVASSELVVASLSFAELGTAQPQLIPLFSHPVSTFLLELVLESKTYLAKVDRSAILSAILSPMTRILDF